MTWSKSLWTRVPSPWWCWANFKIPLIWKHPKSGCFYLLIYYQGMLYILIKCCNLVTMCLHCHQIATCQKKKLMPRVCSRKTVCWRFLVLKPFMLCNTTRYWLIDWFLNVSWAILFSHPADYTPVCTTELGRVAELASEFEKRGVKLFALSCDGVESHKGWIKDIVDYSKSECGESDFPYPIIADEKRELAVKLGMIDPDEKDAQGLPLTARAVSWT